MLTQLEDRTVPSFLASDTSSPYTVTVTATDSVENVSASQTFTWAVTATGAVTVSLVNPGTQSNDDGDTVSLSLSATDSAGNALVYNAANLPPGLVINSSTGVISGGVDPGAHLFGPYSVTVTANDSVNSSIGASQTFEWNIGASTTDTVTITDPGDQTNDDGDSVDLAVSASDSLGNPLGFTAANLPSGLSINAETGAIVGTISASADANSPYDVTVTAQDTTNSSAEASTSFVWTVLPAATIIVTLANPGDQTSTPGTTINLPLSATDSAGNPLIYTATNLPAGLAINASTGVISGTISASDLGYYYDVTVTATDSTTSTASASQTFQWTVPAGTIVGPATVPGNSQYTYTIVFSGNVNGNWVLANATYATLANYTSSYNAATNQTTYVANVAYSNTPALVPLQFYVNNQGNIVASMSITLVEVQITGGSFTPGTPFGFGLYSSVGKKGAGIPLYGVPSGTDDIPGLTWQANVTLLGPNNNQGVSQIHIGFIQHAKWNTYSGFYGGTTYLVSPLEGGPYYLDIAKEPGGTAAQPPWYSVNTGANDYPPTFFDANQDVSSGTIASFDTPAYGPPLDCILDKDAPGGWKTTWSKTPAPPYVQRINLVLQFQLDVAAETTDTSNNANQLYWGEAGVNWTFNGSGTINTYLDWTGVGAGVTAAGGFAWTQFPTLMPEDTSGLTANTVGNRYLFKLATL